MQSHTNNLQAAHPVTYLTKIQLSERLQVSPRSVDNWMKQKRIPFIRLGKSVRFKWASVEGALDRFTIREVRL